MAAFFFDNCTSLRIGRWLRGRGHSVMSTHDIHVEEAEDSEILLYAGPQGLIVVTHNEKDFVPLHQAGTTEHAGILAVPQVSPENAASIGLQIDWLVSSGRPMANELYRFRLDAGWQRWDGDRATWVQL